MTSEPLRPSAIADLGADLQAQKGEAHRSAMESIFSLLDELHGCLGTSWLNGLPRLSRYSTGAYHGVRLRTKSPQEPLPLPERHGAQWGRPCLVINARGSLVIARQNDLGEVDERAATTADLKAEDLKTISEGVYSALQFARNYAQERTEVLDGIKALAEDLGGMLRARRERR